MSSGLSQMCLNESERNERRQYDRRFPLIVTPTTHPLSVLREVFLFSTLFRPIHSPAFFRGIIPIKKRKGPLSVYKVEEQMKNGGHEV